MTTTVTKESLAARIAELESGARSLKEDYTLTAYKMLLATMEAEPVAWIHEDELPDGYPYSTMFPFSKVDIVRMFPVFAPQPAPAVPAVSDDGNAKFGNFQHYWHSKGYVLAPKEPTEAMCDISHIGVDVYCGITDDNEYYSIGGAEAAKVWKAMLAAAPKGVK